MRRHSVSINNLVVLVCILATALQIGVYYFLNNPTLAVFVAILSTIIMTHFFLELSLDYEVCFLYSAIMVVFSLIIALVIFNAPPNKWIQFHYQLIWIVFCNWFFTLIYSIIRDAFDRGPRFENFVPFFHKMNVLCLLIYLGALIYVLFVAPLMPPYIDESFGAHNFVPFMTTGGYIEETLRSGKSIHSAIIYMALLTTLGIPFGFYTRFYLRRMLFLPRLFFMLLIPLFLEFLQACLGIGKGDIDDYCLMLAGTLIGTIIYHLLNALYHAMGKQQFPAERSKPFSQFY